MTLWSLRITALLALTVIPLISAAPASPHGRLYDQPDGTSTPEIFLHGDEYYSWKTDRNGYTVIQDDQDWYVYARKEVGELVSSNIRVGYGNPKKLGLVPNLKTDPDKRMATGLVAHDAAERDHRELLKIPSSALCSFQGTKKNPCRLRGLVVLIRFSDHKRKVSGLFVLSLDLPRRSRPFSLFCSLRFCLSQRSMISCSTTTDQHPTTRHRRAQ